MGKPAVTDIATHLFQIATTCPVPNTNCGPAQLSHQLRQTPVGAGCATALGNFKKIQKSLAAHSFQAIELHLAPDTLQRCQPEIGRVGKSFGVGDL